MNRFYVYAYLRENRYSPYYIGKGTGKRCFQNYNRKGTPTPKDKSRIVIIKNQLTEEESFELEVKLIRFYGRKCDGGILNNFSIGGRGGNNIVKPYTEEHKKRIGVKSKEMWDKLSLRERSERNKRGAQKRDREKYKKLEVWDRMKEEKGTPITITNVDTGELYKYPSSRDAERDGWNRKQIYIKIDTGKIWTIRKTGCKYIVNSDG